MNAAANLAPLLRADGVRLPPLGGAALAGPIAFAAEPGQRWAVLGPNGAGKTTLLRVLAGELAPAGGAVEFAGRPLGSWSPRALARRRAFLEQAPPAPPGLTVGELVLLGRAPHSGFWESARDLRVAARVARDLASGWDERVETRSGGERQRAHLARALAQLWPAQPADRTTATPVPPAEPVLLLLDEPADALDPAAARECLGGVARCAAEIPLAAVATIHDPNLARAWATHLLLLRRAAPARVVAAEALTAGDLAWLYGTPYREFRGEGGAVAFLPA